MADETNEEVFTEIAGDSQVSKLMLLILQQQADNAHATWRTLAESYQRSYYEERARLQLIREDIDYLLSGPCMPMPEVIAAAVHLVAEERVKERARLLLKRDGGSLVEEQESSHDPVT